MTQLQTFEQFYRTYFLRLVSFASTYTEYEEDAEDIVQQVMLKYWDLLQSGESLDNPKAYVYQMVRNACLDYVKHNAVVQERMVKGMEEADIEAICEWDFVDSADSPTLYRELYDQVQSLIAQMPERQREVFLLSREQALKNAEIAEKLSISVKAVEKHMTAALRFLRDNLGKNMWMICGWMIFLHFFR